MDTIDYIKQLIERKPSPEHFQKIISALRGPDMLQCNQEGYLPQGGLERLKYLTTGRIRGIVAPGYMGIITLQPLAKSERLERDDFLHYAPQHFSTHYKEASDAIRVVYGCDLRDETGIDYSIEPRTLLYNKEDK